MKLDAKQMHVVSQLFMAAGKAGRPFDLGRLLKDAAYTSETLAELSLFAADQKNDALQSLCASVMDIFAPVNMPVPAPVPVASTAPSALAATPIQQKYVGQLR